MVQYHHMHYSKIVFNKKLNKVSVNVTNVADRVDRADRGLLIYGLN